MPGLCCPNCTPLCYPTTGVYVKEDPADGVARGVWEEESTKEVPEPHSSEPVDLSLLSLWVQVIKALRDLGRRNAGSFPKIYQRK